MGVGATGPAARRGRLRESRFDDWMTPTSLVSQTDITLISDEKDGSLPGRGRRSRSGQVSGDGDSAVGRTRMVGRSSTDSRQPLAGSASIARLNAIRRPSGPMSPSGGHDAARGLRSFVAGMGGACH